MSYSPPDNDAVNFSEDGSYSPPDNDAVNFSEGGGATGTVLSPLALDRERGAAELILPGGIAFENPAEVVYFEENEAEIKTDKRETE